MTTDELYMKRCIELAKLGSGNVAPNPIVGSVLVYHDRIIGEGYHQQYRKAHAEVNCINSVSKEDEELISQSVIYVSLEPCAHFGKTPPCADLIIQKKIPKVVVGCRDPFKQVDGKGIEKLQQAGVEVTMNVLEDECKELNKRFFTFHTQRRPYIVLKWAQSFNKKISNADRSRVLISNDITNRLVHGWRSEEAGILVGTNTALYDDPSLNTRNWQGVDPVRLVVDMNLRLPASLNVFNQQQITIVFNTMKHEEHPNLTYYQVTADTSLVDQILNACYYLNIQSILVEGGSLMLQSFIDAGAWDEARIIENSSLIIENGADQISIIDIGTGSGCIPIALKKNLDFAEVAALDVSEGALNVAMKNANEQHVAIDFYKVDFLNEDSWNDLEQYDVIVSNPPYIKQSEETLMQRNVLDHEPHLALFVPDNDALIFYRKIALFAETHLKTNGIIFLEINEALGEEVTKLFNQQGYRSVEIKKDMQGKDRMIKVVKD